MLLFLFANNSSPGITGAGIASIAISTSGAGKLSIFGNCSTVVNIFLQAAGAKDGILINNNRLGILQSTLTGVFKGIIA